MTVCLDDVELDDPQFEAPRERAAPSPPRMHVEDQVGCLPSSAKIQALPAETGARSNGSCWNRAGRVVAAQDKPRVRRGCRRRRARAAEWISRR